MKSKCTLVVLLFVNLLAVTSGIVLAAPQGSLSGPGMLGTCAQQAYNLQVTNPGGPNACTDETSTHLQARIAVPVGLKAVSATRGGTVVADGFSWNVDNSPADSSFDAQFTVKTECVLETALQISGEVTYTACPSGTPQQQIISPLTVTVQYADDHSCYEEKTTMFVDQKVPYYALGQLI